MVVLLQYRAIHSSASHGKITITAIETEKGRRSFQTWFRATIKPFKKLQTYKLVCSTSTFVESTLRRCNYFVSSQVPHESVINHTFHYLANTAGKSNKTIICRVWSVFSWLWYWNHIWLTPTRRKVTCYHQEAVSTVSWRTSYWCRHPLTWARLCRRRGWRTFLSEFFV